MPSAPTRSSSHEYGRGHPGRGPGVDEHRLVEPGGVEQAPQLPAGSRIPDGRDELTEWLGQAARRRRPVNPAAVAARRRAGGELSGKRRIDLLRIEAGRADGAGVDVTAEDVLELGDRVRVVMVRRVGGRRYQLVGVHPAGVLGRTVTPAARAARTRRRILPGGDGLELDDMTPVIAEVIDIGELVTRLGQHLVDAHLFLGDAGFAFLHLVRAQVEFGLRTVRVRAGTELVQVRVGPAERQLDNAVYLIEEQV